MTPGLPNPFSGSEPLKPRRGNAAPQRSSDPSSALVHAQLEQCAFGWEARINPMRAFEALRIWPALGASDESNSLLFDVVPGEAEGRAAELQGRESKDRWSLGTAADRLAIPAIEEPRDDYLILDVMALRELIGILDPRTLRCVLVDGPIEPRDARAIMRAGTVGVSPLQVELRAAASINVRDDHSVTFQTRTKHQSLRLVAECFRVYLSQLRSRPIREVAPPEPWQVERLLDISGTISARPIETDAFSSFLDVGISTATEPFSRPADRSLIYDVPSNSWHDEQ